MQKNMRVSGDYVLVYYSPKTELKIGITTSKKVSKLAVDRNYQRRRIRMIIQENEAMLPTGEFIIIVKQPTMDANYVKLSKELCKLLIKARRKFDENETITN
jgi:ribonuclease P protein component